ncbi:maleylpyruvate isomerase family mycothiol-dependent enzyme [Nonomuraea terrae]|uniref:Maleylpyruvate isomerase family mycothiol-dependent enzyme n=1 Tax=Nonomuraea terrae TaxID=2530383 RepID=A0A4R4XMQ2_9ACTN|nr:maleylpyruvate isomerase family mycothiol-dependent enzyme [Nonomuraea terrae]TDD32285.1 maleylpyruvate isomerase family mycothiol-dependent enzyme [Nonomuraea terrae]
MDRCEILAQVEAERLSLADFLNDLSEREWQTDSLCPGWTVHDVAAHLTLSTRSTFLGTLGGVIRAGGDFNTMIATQARARAAKFSPAQLIAQIHQTAGSPRRAPGTGPLDPLVDALVHGQDIARPLGRVRQMPAVSATVALDYVRDSAFYGCRERFRGMRLIATDLDWSAGQGPDEIRGPVDDLLLLATGRPTGLTALSGTGAERIRAAL